MKALTNFKKLQSEIEITDLALGALKQKQNYLIDEEHILFKYNDNLKKIKQKIEEKLKQYEGIEAELFYLITVNGYNVTKAVDKVAFKYDMDVSTIWKYYYPKVKDEIKNIKEKL